MCGCEDVCIRVRVYVYKYIYIYESEQGSSKEREPVLHSGRETPSLIQSSDGEVVSTILSDWTDHKVAP